MHTCVLIEGDGIGPEVASATIKILEAAKAPVKWETAFAGLPALEKKNEVLPNETLNLIRKHHVALKGPCTTPVGKGFSSVNVQLRKKLDLYAAVRPVRSMPGVKTRFENVDLIILRENTEGLYTGLENEITEGVMTSIKVVTEKASRRFAKWGFEYAQKRGRKKITVFHKANIMKKTDGLFLRCAEQIKKEHGFADVELQSTIIDAACMRMVQDPTQFDTLLLGNLYGDIISDLCAGLVGGLGVVPGANIGHENSVFEAVHGSAPDIAGKGVANPLALTMSAVMMLNHLHAIHGDDACKQSAEKIKSAYNQALLDDCKTGDLGGKLSTEQFTQAVIDRM